MHLPEKLITFYVLTFPITDRIVNLYKSKVLSNRMKVIFKYGDSGEFFKRLSLQCVLSINPTMHAPHLSARSLPRALPVAGLWPCTCPERGLADEQLGMEMEVLCP